MKKKIVNVVLSVAVVTSMMFSVTACGSNAETADTAAVESTVAESVAEESTVAEATTEEVTTEEVTTEEATTEDATDLTLDAWVNSEEATTVVDYMNENLQGQSVAFEADGDVFSMVFTLEETMEVADGAQEAMSQLFESQKTMFESIRDQLIEETGNSNISVRVVYINGDGSEIFSTEF